ncbi:TfoX-like protein [Pseudomonas duriflava]|uniref:TfoX-like protein n=1 Tax=Pseudomonas duriflava TaxID=459528 RepID=A0A562Q412_9PSED|nr:TfoX/Sxy family protein [Pseudomonas duriflava]TWI50890.1 TfoX-like protein [Pseudomonas duriflava]
MSDELLLLKNLGKTSVLWLHAVGIRTVDELRNRGSAGAYMAVCARGFRTSKVLLYAIEGALLDIHWNELTPQHKQSLLAQAQALALELDLAHKLR